MQIYIWPRNTETERSSVNHIVDMINIEMFIIYDYCGCQNRRISGRGSLTERLRLMATGGRGHDVYPGSGPLDGGNTLLPA